MDRKDWDSHFFEVAKLTSTRSTCLRRQYGAILVRDKTILSTGFNGPPRGYPHCETCIRSQLKSGEGLDLCKATHAEQNAVANAARFGIYIKGTELYLWPSDIPCTHCTKILINAGVEVIHYTQTGYPGFELSMNFFEVCGVELRRHS